MSAELLVGQLQSLDPDDARRLELTYRLAEDYAAMSDDVRAVEQYKVLAKIPLKSQQFRLAGLAKLGEFYEKAQRWAEAQEVYQDLSRSATDPQWIAAAKARAQAAHEKLAHVAVKSSSSTVIDSPMDNPAPPVKRKAAKRS